MDMCEQPIGQIRHQKVSAEGRTVGRDGNLFDDEGILGEILNGKVHIVGRLGHHEVKAARHLGLQVGVDSAGGGDRQERPSTSSRIEGHQTANSVT